MSEHGDDGDRGRTAAARHVLVGACGGIAIYKTVELVRLLARRGYATTVVETEAARRFVLPLTFAAASQSPVLDDQVAWSASGGWFEHIEAARRADVLVIAPATATTLAKLAAGLADNLLSAIYLAFRGPVILAPSMNWAMYEHPATQHNLRLLAERGCTVLSATRGELACGEEGSGRMAEPEVILAAVQRTLGAMSHGPLAGRKVVVTAGGTREPIDAVRFLGNRSSGRMGRAVAEAAVAHGADVALISTTPMPAAACAVTVVETAAEMAAAVTHAVADADVLVMAAAVSDFRPAEPLEGKIERADKDTLSLDLVRTVDVLAEAARPGLCRVAFAAEAGPRLDRARAKRRAKGVDLMVFNDILAAGIGIGSEDNEITIIGPDREEHVARAPKDVCAEAIVRAIERELAARDSTERGG